VLVLWWHEQQQKQQQHEELEGIGVALQCKKMTTSDSGTKTATFVVVLNHSNSNNCVHTARLQQPNFSQAEV